jgi:AraC-like DNA-binding protein
MRSIVEPGVFTRPHAGLRFAAAAEATSDFDPNRRLPLAGEPGWQSAGGPPGHPFRSLPRALEMPIPTMGGRLVRIHLVGIFALVPVDFPEAAGRVGAQLQVLSGNQTVVRQSLIAGRHYSDSRVLDPLCRLNGDGTSVETVGVAQTEHGPRRVDLLTLDVDSAPGEARFRFTSSVTEASFVLFDVLFEYEAAPTCPFRGRGGGVSLAELGSVVRVADRVRFAQALRQLEDGLRACEDLDEARSIALTFMAVVAAALLEMGAPREMHRFQLDAARRLDRLRTADEIAETSRAMISEIVSPVLARPSVTGDALIDRALAIVERNFGKNLQDSQVADQLGLSTSHFRHLFKQATGQPFHRYLVALRLEKARQFLLEQEATVSEVARLVGFVSAAHFSRAFQKRFSVAPSALRQSRR